MNTPSKAEMEQGREREAVRDRPLHDDGSVATADKWEAGIEEALADLTDGRYEEFDDIEGLIARLHS
jgi:hypothetical protein